MEIVPIGTGLGHNNSIESLDANSETKMVILHIFVYMHIIWKLFRKVCM